MNHNHLDTINHKRSSTLSTTDLSLQLICCCLYLLNGILSTLGAQLNLPIKYIWLLLFITATIPIIHFSINILQRKKPQTALALYMFFFQLLVLFYPAISSVFYNKIPYLATFGKPPIEAFYFNTFLISAFLFAVTLTHCLVKITSNHTLTKFVTRPILKSYKIMRTKLLSLFTLLIIGLIPYFNHGLTGFAHKLLYGRHGYLQFTTQGLGGALLPFLSNFLVVIACLSGFTLISSNRTSTLRLQHKLGFWFLFIFTTLITLSGGGRTRIGLIIVPLFLFSIFNNYHKINIKKLLKYSIIVLFCATLISLMVQVRYGGIQNLTQSHNIKPIDFTGNNLNNEILLIVTHFKQPIACHSTISCLVTPLPNTFAQFATSPIPRSLWPNKYIDPSFGKYNKFRTGHTGFGSGNNVTPTVIGRYYMLYGTAGVIEIGILLGLLLAAADYLIKLDMTSDNLKFAAFFGLCLLYYLCQTIRDFYPGFIYSYLLLYIYWAAA
ncbi:MAG: O-antigen polysaccharide polymerase Wzy [Gammaproteobacteria bacterium]|nr:O-antigen polysaccharide polymerase Wzy [Gammaproteobacteria bacterium]